MSREGRLQLAGAVLLLLASVALALHGQPTPEQKWAYMAPQYRHLLDERQVYIDPAELLSLMNDDYIQLVVYDVRNERDWNLFHLWGAEHIPTKALIAQHERFALLPSNAVVVLMSNDEAEATEAWKLLMATASKPNAYILAGGINRWLSEYADGEHGEELKPLETDKPDETLRYPLKWALGSRHPAAMPDQHELTDANRVVQKVKLQKRIVKASSGGPKADSETQQMLQLK